MQIVGLDGRQYSLKLSGKRPYNDEVRPRSAGHLLLRKLLKEFWPSSPILEEVSLPGTGGLTADFFLPNERIIFECHGIQHYKFVAHFHGTKAGFLKARKNDERKKEWAEKNDIRLIELPDTQTPEEWKIAIENA